MEKTNKHKVLIINAVFSICYIYFITFYSQGTDIQISLPLKLRHFLFQSESGMIPLAVFGWCLIVVTVLSFVLHRMNFSKTTVILNCLGFIPAVAPIAYNMFFGPFIDEKSDMLGLSATVILLIYLILFQIFFIRDYKRISD